MKRWGKHIDDPFSIDCVCPFKHLLVLGGERDRVWVGRGIRCGWGEGSGVGEERDRVWVGRGIRCGWGEGSGVGGERDQVWVWRGIRWR